MQTDIAYSRIAKLAGHPGEDMSQEPKIFGERQDIQIQTNHVGFDVCDIWHVSLRACLLRMVTSRARRLRGDRQARYGLPLFLLT